MKHLRYPYLHSVGAGTLPRVLLLALTLGSIGGSAQANTTLFWDASGTNSSQGGSGTWDTTSSLWDTAATGGTMGTYVNTTPSTITANLGGTAGTVTIATATTINVNNLTFGTGAYTIAPTDATSVLNFSGTTPSINLANLSGNQTISASIANDSGTNLTINATGSTAFLALTGNNAGLTGTTILNLNGAAIGDTAPGVVSSGTNNGFGTSTIQFNSAGQVNYRDNNNGSYGNNVTLNGGNATFNVGRASGSGTGKTLSFGTLTFNTANTFILAGLGNNYQVSLSGVSLAANGNLSFGTANGVASNVGAISETVTGKSFTLSASTAATSSTLTVTGASTYTGATNIQEGVLRDGITNALPTGTVLTLGSTGASTALNLSGFNQTLGGLATAGTAANQTITSNATGSSTLTYNGATSTFGGVISDAGTGKTLGVTVSGGTLSLSGTNTYIGGTTLNGGTTYINGGTAGTNSGAGAGAVAVNSGATLGGSGSIKPTSGGVTVNSGGILTSGLAQVSTSTPGQDVVDGTHLTLDNTAALTTLLSVKGGSTLTFALGAGASSGALNFTTPNTNSTYLKINTDKSGEINFDSSSTINIHLVDLTAPSSTDTLQLRYQNPYLLMQAGMDSDYANLVTTGGLDTDGFVLGVGTLSLYTPFNITATDLSGGTLATPYANLQLYLDNGQLEIVPEPGTWAMMLGGLAVLVLYQQKRRNS